MFDSFEWDPENIPTLKLALHSAQFILAFIAWCIEIAVFRDPVSLIVGDNAWTFAVCFLSIPAWVYLGMAPRYPMTRKIAHPNAMLTIDALFAVLWLSAFATQAAYNTANLCGGACGQSKAVVGLAFFVCLLFIGSTAVSAYTLMEYNANGRLPGYESIRTGKTQNIDPDKAAFSTAPHDEEAYAQVHMDDNENDLHDVEGGYNDRYGAPSPGYGGPSSPGYGHGASAVPENPFGSGAEYHPQVSGGRGYAPPTAEDDYGVETPAQFPAGNYDRVH